MKNFWHHISIATNGSVLPWQDHKASQICRLPSVWRMGIGNEPLIQDYNDVSIKCLISSFDGDSTVLYGWVGAKSSQFPDKPQRTANATQYWKCSYLHKGMEWGENRATDGVGMWCDDDNDDRDDVRVRRARPTGLPKQQRMRKGRENGKWGKGERERGPISRSGIPPTTAGGARARADGFLSEGLTAPSSRLDRRTRGRAEAFNSYIPLYITCPGERFWCTLFELMGHGVL